MEGSLNLGREVSLECNIIKVELDSTQVLITQNSFIWSPLESSDNWVLCAINHYVRTIGVRTKAPGFPDFCFGSSAEFLCSTVVSSLEPWYNSSTLYFWAVIRGTKWIQIIWNIVSPAGSQFLMTAFMRGFPSDSFSSILFSLFVLSLSSWWHRGIMAYLWNFWCISIFSRNSGITKLPVRTWRCHHF